MGIAGVGILLVDLVNGLLGVRIVAEAGAEIRLECLLDCIRYRIGALLCQRTEPLPDLGVVLSGEQVQQPLQIAGNENIHGGGAGCKEFPVPVVHAGVDEVGQHLVDVGCTNQLLYRQTHLLCIISSQDIAEVAGGHHHVDEIPEVDLPVRCQGCICGNIVYDLRQEPSPVDGVGTGEHQASLIQLLLDLWIRKNRLDPVLAIVKVALDGAYTHVAASWVRIFRFCMGLTPSSG